MTDGTIPSLASGLLLSASLTLSLLSARPHCCYSLRAQESSEWSGSRTIFSICLDKMSCCLSKSSETQEAHSHRVQLLKKISHLQVG